MATSQNGWPASSDRAAINIKPFVVAGVSFPGGVAHHSFNDVVLRYVVEQFHARVEKLHAGWCWGYNFRANRNATGLSNHAAGCAVDVNAPLHPNGVPRGKNFSSAQIGEIHEILREVNGLGHGTIVRWGGDYTRTVDAMHFEVIGSRAATTAAGKDIIAGKLNKPVIDLSNVLGAMHARGTISNGILLKKAIATEVGAGAMNMTTNRLGGQVRVQYALVQREFLASQGDTNPSPSDVDGFPGPSSLNWLGNRRGFRVVE